jgi:hypothetical protein
MWQAPNHRTRAAGAKKRERARRPIHLKRVLAEMKVVTPPQSAPVITEVRVMLNDFSSKGLGIFSIIPVLVGQQVAITLQDPTRIYVRGRVVWCREYDADTHVLSSKAYSYRMGIQFVFDSPEEEQAVAEFCELIARDHVHSVTVA